MTCAQVEATWDEAPEAPDGYKIVAHLDVIPSSLISRKILYAWDTEAVRGWFLGEGIDVKARMQRECARTHKGVFTSYTYISARKHMHMHTHTHTHTHTHPHTHKQKHVRQSRCAYTAFRRTCDTDEHSAAEVVGGEEKISKSERRKMSGANYVVQYKKSETGETWPNPLCACSSRIHRYVYAVLFLSCMSG